MSYIGQNFNIILHSAFSLRSSFLIDRFRVVAGIKAGSEEKMAHNGILAAKKKSTFGFRLSFVVVNIGQWRKKDRNVVDWKLCFF